MTINLKDLAASPQGRICFDYTIDLSAEEVNFERPFPAPVRVVGQVSDEAGMIRLQAQVEAEVHTRCARCARPVVYEKNVPIDFLLVSGAAEDEESDDVIAVEGDDVELDGIAVPELLLDMEMAVLCREDCKGLCPKCGKDLNEGPCGCDLRQADPRLEALKKLLPPE